MSTYRETDTRTQCDGLLMLCFESLFMQKLDWGARLRLDELNNLKFVSVS